MWKWDTITSAYITSIVKLCKALVVYAQIDFPLPGLALLMSLISASSLLLAEILQPLLVYAAPALSNELPTNPPVCSSS